MVTLKQEAIYTSSMVLCCRVYLENRIYFKCISLRREEISKSKFQTRKRALHACCYISVFCSMRFLLKFILKDITFNSLPNIDFIFKFSVLDTSEDATSINFV